MKFLIFLTSTIAATWHLQSKIESLNSFENINILKGSVVGTWSDEMIPCMVWTNDVHQKFNFAYLYDSFPLQKTDKAIFFWTRGPKFSLKIESLRELDVSNLKLYCGDISDVLGSATIEDERADKVRISSFPTNKTDLVGQGRFVINKNYIMKQDDMIRLTFPYQSSPKNIYAMHGIRISHKNEKRVWEFRGVFSDALDFIVEYQTDMIVPSYNMIAEIITDDSISMSRRKL